MSTWIEEFYALNPVEVEESATIEKKEHKLDLFKVVLPALDRRNKNFYRDASVEEQRELGKLIWALTRWMSHTKNNTEHHLLMVNDAINQWSSDLKGHPELQWKLLAVCGFGSSQMHQWIAPPKGVKKNKLETAILSLMPLLNDDELDVFMAINTNESLTLFFKDHGLSDKEISEILS